MEAAVRQPSGAKLLRILAFTTAISVMSATMFNIALPMIAEDFELSLSQVSRVSSAFLLIYAVGTITYGRLADSFSLRNLIAFGLILFALGSLIGLIAQHYWTILLGRVLQAVGAAVIPAISEIVPARYFPPESRGRAFGIVMTGLALGSALGPGVAALVMSALHWQWLFCMPLFTLLTLPFYFKHLNDKPAASGGIDWLGGGLFAGATALLLLAITEASWLCAGGFLALFALFLRRIYTAREPFISPGLLRNRPYVSGLAVMFLVTGIGFALVFLSPQLLANVNRLEPELVGFALVPAAAVTAVLGRLGGALADRKGHLFLYFLASALIAGGFVMLSTFAGMSPVPIAIALIFGNLCQSFLYIFAVHCDLPHAAPGADRCRHGAAGHAELHRQRLRGRGLRRNRRQGRGYGLESGERASGSRRVQQHLSGARGSACASHARPLRQSQSRPFGMNRRLMAG